MSNPFDKMNWDGWDHFSVSSGPLYRVAWEWPNGIIKAGHGAWTRNRKVTEDTIAIMNAKYPDIHHWLEVKDGTP
jgi:hypothetical protein